METVYENNSGQTENVVDCSENHWFWSNQFTFFLDQPNKAHNLTDEELTKRDIDYVDIYRDKVPEHKYKEFEDPKNVKSHKANIGPLTDDWQLSAKSIMCAYKIVRTKFEVWGLQTRIEAYLQHVYRLV